MGNGREEWSPVECKQCIQLGFGKEDGSGQKSNFIPKAKFSGANGDKEKKSDYCQFIWSILGLATTPGRCPVCESDHDHTHVHTLEKELRKNTPRHPFNPFPVLTTTGGSSRRGCCLPVRSPQDTSGGNQNKRDRGRCQAGGQIPGSSRRKYPKLGVLRDILPRSVTECSP